MKRITATFLAGLGLALPAHSALTAYGVTSGGSLFSFDPDVPANVTTVGNLGFTPVAIDFRPPGGSASGPMLYALHVGAVTTQLYTINPATGLAAPVGTGFPSVTADYSLTPGQTYGFDFNPRTLAADGSIRIRLVASGGANLRLNSDTGSVAAVDTPILTGSGAPRGIDAAAYLNSSVATDAAGGTTTLFVLDATTNSLGIQNPPNAGVVTPVGLLGVTVDANPGIAFDIYSDPLVTDNSLLGDRAFAAFTRDDVAAGAYLLYDVNLAGGQATNGRLVGGGLDFSGGLAVIPEPSSALLGLLGLALLGRRRPQP